MLADLNDIPSAARTAFQARLKNFHRLGYPRGIGTGRGRAVFYGVGELVQMALAVELTQLGLTPERAIAVIEADQYPMLMSVSMAAGALIHCPHGFDPDMETEAEDPLSMYLYFDPAALSPWSDRLDDDIASATFFYGGTGVVRENLTRWTTGPTRRLSLINVTAMLWYLVCRWKEEKRRAFFEQAQVWADSLMRKDEFDLDEWLRSLRSAIGKQIAVPSDTEWKTLREVVESSGYRDREGELFDLPGAGRSDLAEPDMLLLLPNQHTVSIDDKIIPLSDFPHEAIEDRIRELAEHPYRSKFSDNTEYLVLYVRGEKFLSDALHRKPALWDWAFEQRVLLATPANLRSILDAVAKAWEKASEASYGDRQET